MSERTTDHDHRRHRRHRRDRLGATPLVVRTVLLALGAVQALNGLYALLAPRSFFDDFPLGRGWVEALPAYNEHLVRDVGGLFLATAVLLIAAGIYLERRLTLVAALSFLAFSIPHFIFHLLNLEPYDAVDVIGNVVALAITVIAPAWIVLALAGGERGGAGTSRGGAAQASETGANANGRIRAVPDGTGNPLVRYAFRNSRKRDGVVMDPLRVFAHHPLIMSGYGGFELATERAGSVPDRIKSLAELRAAMLCGCEWCLDYGSAVSTAKNIEADDLRALPEYATSDRFDELECLVLDYATGMSQTPAVVSDELFAALAEHFDERQLVELTNQIALENYRARFNWAFGLAGQGYSEGAYCLAPAQPEAAKRG